MRSPLQSSGKFELRLLHSKGTLSKIKSCPFPLILSRGTQASYCLTRTDLVSHSSGNSASKLIERCFEAFRKFREILRFLFIILVEVRFIFSEPWKFLDILACFQYELVQMKISYGFRFLVLYTSKLLENIEIWKERVTRRLNSNSPSRSRFNEQIYRQEKSP